MKKDFYGSVAKFIERQFVKFAIWQSRKLVSLAQSNYEHIMNVGLAVHYINKYGTPVPSMQDFNKYNWRGDTYTPGQGGPAFTMGIDLGDGKILVSPTKTISKEK